MSTPSLPWRGVSSPSSPRKRRPVSSSTSRTAFLTPAVTSSNGASTVVGASPRQTRRYSPPCSSMRIAFVVVLPQSVAMITRGASATPCCLPPRSGRVLRAPPRHLARLAGGLLGLVLRPAQLLQAVQEAVQVLGVLHQVADLLGLAAEERVRERRE